MTRPLLSALDEFLVHVSVPIVGGSLTCWIGGAGPPIVLLHKLGGHGKEWRRVLPPLAGRFTVVIVELPGHGGSRLQGEPPFVATQEAMAAEIRTALDELRVQTPFSCIGSSVGASVALAIAALWPSDVAAVISLGAALTERTPYPELRTRAAAAIAAGEYQTDGRPATRSVEKLQAMFGIADASIAEEMEQSRRAAGPWIGPLARGVDYCDFPTVLGRVRAPVTLAFGVRGNYGPYAEPAARWLPSARIVPIDASGAFPHEEAPAGTVELIQDALAGL